MGPSFSSIITIGLDRSLKRKGVIESQSFEKFESLHTGGQRFVHSHHPFKSSSLADGCQKILAVLIRKLLEKKSNHNCPIKQWISIWLQRNFKWQRMNQLCTKRKVWNPKKWALLHKKNCDLWKTIIYYVFFNPTVDVAPMKEDLGPTRVKMGWSTKMVWNFETWAVLIWVTAYWQG